MISYADRILTEGDGLPYRQVVRVMLLVEESEATDLLANYDPANTSSPPDDKARFFARAIADALLSLKST